MERRTRERRRREVLSADLDRLDATRGLWSEADAVPRDRVHDAVRAAVAGALTDKQRAVVEACFFEGLSQGEAAARLGITQQVVSKTLHGVPREGRIVGGALRKLREVLSPVIADLGVAMGGSAGPPHPSLAARAPCPGSAPHTPRP